jgi:hypothetical protein
MTPEAQRRIESLRASTVGAVLSEYLQHKLDETKTALIAAPLDNVQKLQGKAAAYSELYTYFSKGRE